MPSPSMQIVGAFLVLGLYYFVLVLRPQATPEGPDSQELRHAMEASERHYGAGAFQDALGPTQYLVEQMPSQPVYAARLARIYERLERPLEAAAAWAHVMDVSATPEDGCPMIGQAYTSGKDPAAAIGAFERCVSVDPRNPDFQLFVGQAYAAVGRDADARKAFEIGLALAPDYPDLHLLLGVRDFVDKQLVDARRHFEQFLELSPDRRAEVEVWLKRTEVR